MLPCGGGKTNILCVIVGVEGGFGSGEPEYEEKYNIVILPEYASLPFPSVELPEKVLTVLFKNARGPPPSYLAW